MKKIIYTFLMSLISLNVFGQQFLWSTAENDTIKAKHVSFDEVTGEVLKFYDDFKRYYNFTGYSKERFINEICPLHNWGNSDDTKKKIVGISRSKIEKKSVLPRFINELNCVFDDWEWLFEITNLTVFALIQSTEEELNVLVLGVSKDKVNLIIFSDTLKGPFNKTHPSNREKFTKWFETLLIKE